VSHLVLEVRVAPNVVPLSGSTTSAVLLGDISEEVLLAPKACVMSGCKYDTSGSASNKIQYLVCKIQQGKKFSVRLFLIACMTLTASMHSKDVCLEKNYAFFVYASLCLVFFFPLLFGNMRFLTWWIMYILDSLKTETTKKTNE